MLVAILLGTSVMVNAQTEPAKTAPAKEVKSTKKLNKKAKTEKKVEATKPAPDAPAKK